MIIFLLFRFKLHQKGDRASTRHLHFFSRALVSSSLIGGLSFDQVFLVSKDGIDPSNGRYCKKSDLDGPLSFCPFGVGFG